MNNKFSKILTAIALVLAIITAFFYIRLLYLGDDELKASADFQNSIISPFIWFTVIVLIATIAISIFSSVFSLVRKPEQLKKPMTKQKFENSKSPKFVQTKTRTRATLSLARSPWIHLSLYGVDSESQGCFTFPRCLFGIFHLASLWWRLGAPEGRRPLSPVHATD